MRFSQLALLACSAIGLTHGLAIPKTSDNIEARSAAGEFSRIVARAFTCKAKEKTACTKCPKYKLKKGASSTKPAAPAPCPKGKKCKRSDEDGAGAEVATLEERATIDMDSMGSGEWKDGDVLETAGLSYCSVMAVFDRTKFAMAHIPPARADGQGLAFTGIDVINEYKTKMGTAYTSLSMQSAQGYLLVSSAMDPANIAALRQWFTSRGITYKEKIYGPNDVVAGSGNFVISRETKTWPPLISFA